MQTTEDCLPDFPHLRSLSDMMLVGIPQPAIDKKSSRRIAQISAVSVSFPGRRPALFDSWHVTDIHALLPFVETDKPTIKSIQIHWKGNETTSIGMSDPRGL